MILSNEAKYFGLDVKLSQ